MKRLFISIALISAFIGVYAKGVTFPLVDAARFDTIMDGKKVALYTITNGKVAAQVTNFGGFVVSMFAPDKDGKFANLVTGYESIHQYLRYNMGMVGPALGRYANRIANGHFVIGGNEYNVTKNSGPHTLHGGSKGFDHTVWDVVKATKNKLVLCCVLPDGLDGFPGTLKTTLTYSVTKDNGLSISYEAETDKPTVVNLSNHTYFNLNGAGSGDIMDHMLSINAEQITETDRANIPTGKFLPVEGTPYDFRQPVRIGDRTVEMKGGFGFGMMRMEIPEGKVRQYDNNFCLAHKSGDVELVAVLHSPLSGRTMEVWNNHPGLQVYTGARTAIALESQMFPDSPNHPEFPSTEIHPGQIYRHTVIYKFK